MFDFVFSANLSEKKILTLFRLFLFVIQMVRIKHNEKSSFSLISSLIQNRDKNNSFELSLAVIGSNRD